MCAAQEHRDAITDIMSRITACFTREVASAIRKSKAPANGQQHAGGSAHTGGASSGRAANSAAEAGNGSLIISELPTSSRSSVDGLAALATAASAAATAVPAALGARSHSGALVTLPPSKNSFRPLAVVSSAAPPQAAWLRQVVDLLKEREVCAGTKA